MDETDVTLSKLLLTNSRLSYRELADRLDLSVNAVHKRIQTLIEQRIIRAFTAKINLYTLKGVPVLVFGRSEAQSFEACEKLGRHGSTYWVGVAGGNYLYVGAYLQDIGELEPYVDFLKKEAQMPDPTVGIERQGADSPFSPSFRAVTLYPLDYQIIHALRNNSRKLISEVAEELGVSAKTVRRRLSRMISEGLIELSIKWYPDASNDIMTIFHLHLKASADKSKVGPFLLQRYSPHAIHLWSFSNLPNHAICVVWTNTMKKLREILESLQKEPVFQSVNPNILYAGFIFDTWRDRIVSEKGAPARKEETTGTKI